MSSNKVKIQLTQHEVYGICCGSVAQDSKKDEFLEGHSDTVQLSATALALDLGCSPPRFARFTRQVLN